MYVVFVPRSLSKTVHRGQVRFAFRNFYTTNITHIKKKREREREGEREREKERETDRHTDKKIKNVFSNVIITPLSLI
ncbi:unnamed protein product [Parnassius mnemosyne]|uniref:Ribosomal protein S17 n=1 Tax=Parnassius mnemosyne TaxID=213953 RepID=A0AAV1M623_9NEOP